MDSLDRLVDHELRLRQLEERQWSAPDHTHPELTTVADVIEVAEVIVDEAVEELADEVIEVLEDAVVETPAEEPVAEETAPEPEELAHSGEPEDEVEPDRSHWIHRRIGRRS